MISINANFDFTRIRRYHYEIELISSSKEKRNETITSILQTIYIDLDSSEKYQDFISRYIQLFESYRLNEEVAFDLLFLIQKTYGDIEIANEVNNDLLEAQINLSFLTDVIKLKETNKSKTHKFSKLNLTIEGFNGSSTLRNSMVTDYVINQIIKAFQDITYNPQLANLLVGQEITFANLDTILKKLSYKTSNINRYCTAQTATRIKDYLNEQTDFSSPSGGLLSKQARFIFEILSLFNLIKHIDEPTKMPRLDIVKIENYKTSLIKTLIKNHNSTQKSAN